MDPDPFSRDPAHWPDLGAIPDPAIPGDRGRPARDRLGRLRCADANCHAVRFDHGEGERSPYCLDCRRKRATERKQRSRTSVARRRVAEQPAQALPELRQLINGHVEDPYIRQRMIHLVSNASKGLN